MSQPADPVSAKPWMTLALFCVLVTVVVIAPVAPFVTLFLVTRGRPDLWAAYWLHPWTVGSLLCCALAGARVAFLLGLNLLARVSSAAIYPASYAWLPEMMARIWFANRGLDVSPRPDESPFRFCAIVFALNTVFWFGVLILLAVGKFW